MSHFENKNVKNAIKLKSQILRSVYDYFFNKSFTQITTPLLSFSTKEYGDGEFVVFSKLNPGMYYALPHSPQLYKQYIIAAFGEELNGYFQIAKNFRPEIGDAIHAQEFEQVDFEVNNAKLDDIIKIIIDLISNSFSLINIKPKYIELNYDEAMEKYGTDSPDLRYKKAEFFYKMEKDLVCFLVDKEDIFTDKLDIFVKSFTRYINIKLDKDSNFIFYTTTEHLKELGRIRNLLIEKGVVKKDTEWSFVLLKNMPLFVKRDGEMRTFHHPQASPIANNTLNLKKISEKELLQIRTQSCDLIVNGIEIAGGNVRINDYTLQKDILDILGVTNDGMGLTFKPLLAMLKKYPQYSSAGAAVGLDRLTMLISGASSLSETQFFPMTYNAEEFFGGPIKYQAEHFLEYNIEEIDELIYSSRRDALKIINSNNNFIHNKEHVLNVEKNVITIGKIEGVSLSEMQALRIASHWHDVGRVDNKVEKESHEKLSVSIFKKWANKNIKDVELIKNVVDIITEHRCGYAERRNRLSSIFWDADKLDILNISRIKKILSHYSFAEDKKVIDQFNIFDSLIFWRKIDDHFIKKFNTTTGKSAAQNIFPIFKKFIDEEYAKYIVHGKKIIGIGGAEQISGRFMDLDRKILDNDTMKRILYIPFAIFKNEKLMKSFFEYTNKVKEYYISIDPKVEFDTILPHDSIETILDKINTASILYLSGGDTRELIDILNNVKIKEALFEAYEKGKYIIGNSAGIISLADDVFSFAAGKLKHYNGVGLLKKDIIIVHYDESKKDDCRYIKKKYPFRSLTTLKEEDFCLIFSK